MSAVRQAERLCGHMGSPRGNLNGNAQAKFRFRFAVAVLRHEAVNAALLLRPCPL
jgi:hypothetical protein